MIFNKIKRIYYFFEDKVLSPKEPDWQIALFFLLFSFITIRYVAEYDLSIIHLRSYYSLPLFDFFHIPDPFQLLGFINEFFSVSLSLERLFLVLKKITILLLLFSVLGLFFQRGFVFLSLLFFFAFQSYLYGFLRTEDNPSVYHSANIIFFILLIWTVSPLNKRWTAYFWISKLFKKKEINLKSYPQWPRALIILTIGIVYFGSFYCKLDTSGFQWINGHNLQYILLSQSQLRPLSYGHWLAQQNFFIIWFLNIGVWVFQSTAPIGFFLKKTRLFYGAVGFIFHLSLLFFFGINFTPFYYFYVVFIPELFEFLSKFLKNKG